MALGAGSNIHLDVARHASKQQTAIFDDDSDDDGGDAEEDESPAGDAGPQSSLSAAPNATATSRKRLCRSLALCIDGLSYNPENVDGWLMLHTAALGLINVLCDELGEFFHSEDFSPEVSKIE